LQAAAKWSWLVALIGGRSLRYRIYAVCVALALSAAATPAHAQAALVASVPASGARVPAGDFAFHLRFNSLIDHVRSRFTLTRADDSSEFLVIAEAGPPQGLIALARLSAGAYVLQWEALPVGGRVASGSLSFTVGAR
jgi:methionine-rich copper-binding protein CopC